MKQCPTCERLYPDETLNYCLEDGAFLIDAPEGDDRATAILPGVVPPASRAQLRSNENVPKIAVDSRRKYLIGVAVVVVAIAAIGFIAYCYWPSQKQIASIAVMPFANQSGNADLEYLSDGMTESLISSLSQIPALKVKARSSVFRYKGRDIDPSTAGNELSVDAIVTGRLVQQANSIILYAELVDSRTEDVLWKGDYTRPSANLLLLQNELARDIANKLQAKLSGNDRQRLDRPQTTNEEAYRLYLLGRYHVNRLTDDGFRKGVEYYQQAITNDPNYAAAYAGLADAYNRLGGFNADRPRDSFPRARDAALRAIELDNNLAEAHAQLAVVKVFYDWDWLNAESEFKRAIELNPGNAEAHFTYGLCLSVMGRPDAALVEIRAAQELDPLSLEKQMGVGDVFYYQHRYDDALVEYQKAIDMDPNSGIVNWSLGRAYLEKRMYPEAITSLQKSILFSGDSPDEPADLARAYARARNKSESMKVLSGLLQSSERRYISPTTIGSVYGSLGEKDKAFEWFGRALKERDYLLVFVRIDPMFDDVRDDPRFAKLAEQIGF